MRVTLFVDMTHVHVPVLAGELIDALDPAPGQIAVDCTFGPGGHARLVADRIGAGGELICIDRDPQAEERFAEFADEVACSTRFIRGNYADVLPAAARRGTARGPPLYGPRNLVAAGRHARARLLLLLRCAARHAHGPGAGARRPHGRERVARGPARVAIFREYGEERYARQIAREIVRRRARAPFETTTELVAAIKRAVPRPAQFGAGHPARRVFQAIRIAVNDELGSLERALPAGWDLLRPGGRMAAISFHSLEDRRVKQFFAELARGCICPPDLPVCVCGREPEAELITPPRDQADARARSRTTRVRARANCAPPRSCGTAIE